jgi:hypothetical protein
VVRETDCDDLGMDLFEVFTFCLLGRIKKEKESKKRQRFK